MQDRAIEIGLTDRETMIRKREVFMIEFYIVMLAALVVIIRLWNHVWDFKTAYMQALLFLEVMNWYDGIFIDKFGSEPAGSGSCPDVKISPMCRHGRRC